MNTKKAIVSTAWWLTVDSNPDDKNPVVAFRVLQYAPLIQLFCQLLYDPIEFDTQVSHTFMFDLHP